MNIILYLVYKIYNIDRPGVIIKNSKGGFAKYEYNPLLSL